MNADDGSSKTRRGIQSVEIGLRVLAVVAAHRAPSALTVIAQSAGLSASQAHRYLSSLISSQMVRQVPGSSLYDLDAGSIRIGLAALARLNVLTMADEVFAKYALSTGRTAIISKWGDAGPTIIRWFDGDPAIITSIGLGSVLPLLQSATGRVFFAFGPEATMDRHATEAAKRSRRRLEDFSALRAETRERLFSAIEGDIIPGLRATAAPILDLQGRLTLVAAGLATEAQNKAEDTRARDELLSACRHLTESLGGIWPGTARGEAEPRKRAPRARRGAVCT